MLFLRLHFQGIVVNEIFWGLWLIPFGILVIESRFLPKVLGVLLLIIAVSIVVTQLIAREPSTTWVPLRPRAALLAGVGALVGFLVSVTSIGAGSITLTALILILPRMRLQALVGSDVAFATIIVPIAALGHLGGCRAAVAGLMTSSSAISLLDRPRAAISSTISCSRGVSGEGER